MVRGATKREGAPTVREGAPLARNEAGDTELLGPPAVPPAAPEPAGRIPPNTMIGDRYRIERVLGEGGMGVVYAAEHVLMRKEVAVKVLHAEMCSVPEVVGRFEREAIAAAHVDHPNVAGATDFGRLADGSCYLVLELLRGTTLRDELAKGPLPLSRALHILRGIASGVGAAHGKGVVHRDLKPENVMLVERDGDVDFVKVLDFGIAKVDVAQSAGKIVTRVGTIFGTPEYMAPEQAVGDAVDARADLYSLGVMFLEMLTGVCPFAGKPLSILRERILASGPPDMSSIVDPGARALISRLLTRFPDDRVQTAAELVLAIDAFTGERRVSGPPSLVPAAPARGASLGPPPPARDRRWLLVPVGIGAAAVITFVAFAGVKALSAPHAAPSAEATPASAPPPIAEAPSALPEVPGPEPAPPPTTTTTAAAPAVSAASARTTRAKTAPHPTRPAAKKGGAK